MLSNAVWLEQAQRSNMQLGQRRRFGHDCGPGKVVLVSREYDGLHAHCFRCDDTTVHQMQTSMTAVSAALRARAEELFSARVALPSDFTLDIPEQHAVWLYKASILKEQARRYGIGWSKELGRIILPVYTPAKELAFIQARAVDFPKQQPKYLNNAGAAAKRALFLADENPVRRDVLVFTEDILSAIRVGRFCEAGAICGVRVNDYVLSILSRYKTIILWLDPDTAGVSGMRKAAKLIELYHDDVRRILSQRDPKLLTNRAIEAHLTEVLGESVLQGSSPPV